MATIVRSTSRGRGEGHGPPRRLDEGMAVLIASDLRKDIAGAPLLRGVSFKLERRERLTIAGRNGAGKTTLLRMLAGETSVDGGELVFEKNAKVALHDQRPPRERGLTLRDYVLSGAAELVAIEQDLARLEGAMAGGAVDDATLGALLPGAGRAGGGRRLHLARAGDGHHPRPRLRRGRPGPVAADLLGRRADARRRWRGCSSPARTCCSSTSRPTTSTSRRSSGSSSSSSDGHRGGAGRPRPLVPRGGRHGGAGARGRPRRASSPGRGTPGGASRPRASWRSAGRSTSSRRRSRGWSASSSASGRRRRKARQAQSRVKALDKIERIERDPRDERELAFSFKPPERSGRVVFEMRGGRLEVGDEPHVLLEDAELWLERGEHVSLVGANGTGKSTLINALVGRRQLDGGQAAPRPQRAARVPLPARRGADGTRGRCSRPASARPA